MSPSFASLRVLLVDDDRSRRALLSGGLRERGLTLVEADDASAITRRGEDGWDMLLVAESVHRKGGAELEAAIRRLGAPHLVLVNDPETVWTTQEVHHEDVDLIARRVTDVLRLAAPPSPRRMGTLSEAPLLPLVESLHQDHATGVLSINTTEGAGELRFARGELVDAVFSRIEGAKAFFRLTRETRGSFVFTAASPLVMRRITMPTGELLRAAAAENERVSVLRSALGDLGGYALSAERGRSPPPSGLAAGVFARLAEPHTLEALLDDSTELDSEILGAIVELDRAGHLRRVRKDARIAAFESPDAWNRIAALSAHARAAGFHGPARVILAGPRAAVSLCVFAAARLDETGGSVARLPEAPVPCTFASLGPSEEGVLDLVALPLESDGAPLWPLALAGSVAAVSLSEPGDALRAACSGADVPLIEGLLLVPRLDPGSPEHVARLLRAALGLDG